MATKKLKEWRIREFSNSPLLQLIGLGLITTGLLFSASLVLAQDSAPSDDEVNRVARELYCPVCENIPLDVCPTQACADWRADIRDKLAQGWTDEQIKTYFAQQYGDRVLARPPARGLSALVYIIPVVTVVGGAFALYRFLRAQRQRATLTSSPAPSTSTPAFPPDDYRARLEQELKERF
jgi:cytochrome c-type biogenesis protein CcmH